MMKTTYTCDPDDLDDLSISLEDIEQLNSPIFGLTLAVPRPKPEDATEISRPNFKGKTRATKPPQYSYQLSRPRAKQIVIHESTAFINQFSGPNAAPAFAKIFLDTVKSHQTLYEYAGIIHGDISIYNLMFKTVDGVVHGILLDFDDRYNYDPTPVILRVIKEKAAQMGEDSAWAQLANSPFTNRVLRGELPLSALQRRSEDVPPA